MTASTKNLVANEFGLLLRHLREARGWSQERLAEHAELNRSFVGDLERGEALPSLTTLGKLAVAFHLRPSILLARLEASSPAGIPG
jgi:transcriptional regulator with XRE-family HTH domain